MTTNVTLYLIPCISAFIGWMTNYLAVKMLFHPRNEIKFLFFSIQGVFPKRQKSLAKSLGELVATELFSSREVAIQLKQGVRSPEVEGVLREGIKGFIHEKLPSKVPILAVMLKPEFSEKIETLLLDSVTPLVDDVIDSVGDDLSSTMDIAATVEEKVANFSSEKLEKILFDLMAKEFRSIELLGGVLGFVIGCIQVILFLNAAA